MQRSTLEIVALDRIGIGHDRGEAANQLDRLQQDIFHRSIIGIIVIGVQRQYASGQLVHNVPAGMAHDHVLGKTVRQLSGPLHDLVKVIQLRFRGQIAKQQQIGHLFKAESTGLAVSLHNFVQLNTAVIQSAGNGYALAVLNEITLHAAHLGDAGKYAGAVAVAQSLFYVAAVVFFTDQILLPDQLSQRACEFFQCVAHVCDLLSSNAPAFYRDPILKSTLIITRMFLFCKCYFSNIHFFAIIGKKFLFTHIK